MDTTTWPRVEVRTLTVCLGGRQRLWGEWYTVAVVREIHAAKALVEWYRKLDDDGLEARCVVWQPPKVLEE